MRQHGRWRGKQRDQNAAKVKVQEKQKELIQRRNEPEKRNHPIKTQKSRYELISKQQDRDDEQSHELKAQLQHRNWNQEPLEELTGSKWTNIQFSPPRNELGSSYPSHVPGTLIFCTRGSSDTSTKVKLFLLTSVNTTVVVWVCAFAATAGGIRVTQGQVGASSVLLLTLAENIGLLEKGDSSVCLHPAHTTQTQTESPPLRGSLSHIVTGNNGLTCDYDCRHGDVHLYLQIREHEGLHKSHFSGPEHAQKPSCTCKSMRSFLCKSFFTTEKEPNHTVRSGTFSAAQSSR